VQCLLDKRIACLDVSVIARVGNLQSVSYPEGTHPACFSGQYGTLVLERVCRKVSRNEYQDTMSTESVSLYCLPFAGGNSFFYRPLAQFCSAHVRVCPLELPGRGRRSREALCVSMEAMADDLFRQLATAGEQGRYALFGHSMGALLAFLLAQRMGSASRAMPEALFLSGAALPSVSNGQARHLLPRSAFFGMLREMGGCPPEVLNEPALLDYFEPILRADFQAVDTWRVLPSAPLPVPFVVLCGKQDMVCEDVSRAWRERTCAAFRRHEFEGGHFFLQHHWPQIARIVGEQLPERRECHVV
jgi:surfactin synthase thioesterase subunit